MPDAANKWTDEQLEALEKRIAKEYRAAQKEIREKQEKFLADYSRERSQRLKALDNTDEAKQEYEAWLKRQTLRSSWMDEMVSSFTASTVRANQRAMELASGAMPAVFAENANYAAYSVDRVAGIDTAFALVDEQTIANLIVNEPDLLPAPRTDIAKRARLNKQRFTSAITQGILQGESVNGVAKRIQSVVKMDFGSAKMAARLAVTSAENAGRVSSYERAKAMGIKLKQEWVATLDSRTRHSHRLLDGEKVEVGEKFSNGLRYPGDPTGPGQEIWGCRCTLIAAVDGFETDDAERWSKLPKGTSYEEWKEGQRELALRSSYDDIGPGPQRPKAKDFTSDEELDAARKKYRADREEYIERKEQLIQQLASEPAHGYQSKEAALRWAKGRNVKIREEVFETVDMRALDEIIHVTDELFDKYSIVLTDFKMFDSQFVIQLLEEGNYNFMEAAGGLQLSRSLFTSYEEVCREVVRGYTTEVYNEVVGRTLRGRVRGDGSFKTAVTHEFGHNLDRSIKFKRFYAGEDIDFAAYNEYEKELKELTMRHTTSDYSLVNSDEMFAEGFAEMECNPESEYGQAFATFLARWL